MINLTLLIMAAGMGSRYGGLKQLDKVGPNGETIIDYSIYDAIKAGFNKIVFVIRKDFEEEFKLNISDQYSNIIDIIHVFQDMYDIPAGYRCHALRKKPWGTGQAILCAKNFIDEPFIVINGDDYYGRESFEVISDYYQKNKQHFSMVAFRLDKTLSNFGPVTRGICSINNNQLCTVVETENIENQEDMIVADRNIKLNGSEPVSMNMWGFTPAIFHILEDGFINFLKVNDGQLESEYLIPTVINKLIMNKQEEVHVLRSNAIWFGITYKDDKQFVIKKIQELIHGGVYSSPLFQ